MTAVSLVKDQRRKFSLGFMGLTHSECLFFFLIQMLFLFVLTAFKKPSSCLSCSSYVDPIKCHSEFDEVSFPCVLVLSLYCRFKHS